MMPSEEQTPYRWVEHEGVRILELDLQGCSGEEATRRQALASRFIATCPERSVLSLSRVWGIRYDPRYMRQITIQMRENERFMAASAIVGLEHLTRLVNILNRLSGRKVRAFNDEETAIQWLVSMSGKSVPTKESPAATPGTL